MAVSIDSTSSSMNLKESAQMSQSPMSSTIESHDSPVSITTTVGSGPNKRKEVMTLPLPPGALPPRKRAKTKDEKEQRRIERIMRNRQAAHASREKKRRHVEELEKKCVSLTSENHQLHSGFSEIKSQTSQLMDKFKNFATLVESAKSNGDLAKLDTQKLLTEAMALLKPVTIPTPSANEFLTSSQSNSKYSSPDQSHEVDSSPEQSTEYKTQIKSESRSSITSSTLDSKSSKPSKSENDKSTSLNTKIKSESETSNTSVGSPYSDSGSPLSVPSLSSSVTSSPRSYPLDIMNKSESDSVLGLDDPSSFLGLLEYRSHHPAEMMCSWNDQQRRFQSQKRTVLTL